MNRYTYRRKFDRNSLTWDKEFIEIDGTELPKTPAGYDLFTITKL